MKKARIDKERRRFFQQLCVEAGPQAAGAVRRLLEHLGPGEGRGFLGVLPGVSLAVESVWDVVVGCLCWFRVTMNREV